MAGPRRVRDDPSDAGFAHTYAALPDAVDLEPWLTWCRAADPPVLYIGPGAGRLAVPLSERGVQLVGVDPHPVMREHLARRLPAMEVIAGRIETVDLGGRTFDLVIAPSSVLGDATLLRGAARASRRRVGLELMNPHWLAGPANDRVAVEWLPDGAARLEVPYPNGDVQEATVTLVPPERVEDHLAAAGLELEWLGGGPGLDLESSPTYFVLARIRARPPRTSRAGP